MAMLRVTAALLLSFPGLRAQPLEERIAAVLRGSPVLARVHWGANVVDLENGDVVFDRNSNAWFIPASTQKLFSAALALVRLGPDHRMRTRVIGEGHMSNGVWHGDLVLVGDGDPTFCGPEFLGPLEPGSLGLPCLDSLAAHVAERGVSRVAGRIIGDDSAFLWEPYPEGWVESDLLWDYGAPVSALTLHRNTAYVRIRPGAGASEAPTVTTFPAVGFFTIDARVRAAEAAGTNVRILGGPDPRTLLVNGVVPASGKGASFLVAIRDPAQYAAVALQQSLAGRGIPAEQPAGVRHAIPPLATLAPVPTGNEPLELAAYESPPLAETLSQVLKNSQNLYAELVLLAAAREGRRTIGRRQALEALLRFAKETGAEAEDLAVEDGSGLSRVALATPKALTLLLAYMDRSEYARLWRELLSEGGVDGTLRNRFRGLTDARVQAKTGTMTQVGALAGYLTTTGGKRLAFSLMVNNANLPASVVRQFIDTIVVELIR